MTEEQRWKLAQTMCKKWASGAYKNRKRRNKMNKNLIPEIAKMLGVEIGEEFEVEQKPKSGYKFEDDGLFYSSGKIAFKGNNHKEWKFSTSLYEIITGEYTIKKLPPKPTLNETERVILGALDKKWKWIVRDGEGDICLCDIEPIKLTNKKEWSVENYMTYINPLNHLFQFIKWEDAEPYNIAELLGVE